MSTARLFEPLAFDNFEVKNRVFMAPMTRLRAEGGVPTELVAEYYRQRAGAGLIVTECTAVSNTSTGTYINAPGMFTDEQQSGWSSVVDAVHEAGGRIFLQLWHAGRVAHQSLMPGQRLPLAPSAISGIGELHTFEGKQSLSEPSAMTRKEILQVVADFAAAAERAESAGFDGVELHGAFGYLIEQFLVSGANRRDDEYGGSAVNRRRFLLDVIDAVQGQCRLPVGVKLSPSNTAHGVDDADRAETFGELLAELSGRGLAYVHIMQPLEHDKGTPGLVEDTVAFARQRFPGRIIANGGYDKAKANLALGNADCDAVSFGTLFIANPALPAKLARDDQLAMPDFSTVYGVPGNPPEQGYTDYA